MDSKFLPMKIQALRISVAMKIFSKRKVSKQSLMLLKDQEKHGSPVFSERDVFVSCLCFVEGIHC